MEKFTYTTARINGGPNLPCRERNEFVNVVNVSIGATREHRATAGKSEPVAFNLNPILHCLLNAKFSVRNVIVPRIIAALRPLERRLVLRRRRNHTEEQFFLGRTMALSVFQHAPIEFPCPSRILTGSVFAVRHLAGGDRLGGYFHGIVDFDAVVALEVEQTRR